MNKAYYKLMLLFAVVVLAFLSLYLFAASMSKAMSSDEQMYCTGGYLISKGLMIYRDFSYATQLPYHPLLCAAVYKLTGTTHYLLAARLISIAFDIFIIICIFSTFRKIFAEYYFSGTLLGLAACTLFVFNPFVSYLLGVAWNHDMTLLCIVLSFRIFIGEKHNTMRIFTIAALLTIAVWTRATSVFIMPIFLAMVIAKTRSNNIIINSARAKAHPTSTSLLAITLGVIAFSIVPVYIAIASGRAFFVNIFLVSMLHGQLLHDLHIAYDKSYLTIWALRNFDSSFLIMTAVFICFCVFVFRKKITITQKTNALLAFLLLITSFIITYFPPTMWKQYFGIPVIFIIIVMGFGLLYLRTTGSYKICVAIFVALSLATMISQKPISKISKCLSPDNWTPIKIHNISKQIVATAQDSKTILTLSPLYAIEGGGQIYNELSAGVSAFRVADKLSATDRAVTHTAGLKELPKLTNAKPAGAIVIGPELTRFDKIDLKSIVPPDWQRIDCGNSSVHNFFPPKGL
ncbi:MAG: hypothetical protein LLF92_00150 [Planctomycetaceae bacterium]|nr:hypothetical protein [Planctomycetaceae bacterium]